MELRFIDSTPITAIRTTADGYRVAEVPVARTGIQDYAGWEVGKPDMPVVRMYRPPEAVFADSYLRTIPHKPVTDDHPKEGVTAANWRKYSAGYTGDTIRKDEAAGLIYVPMLFADQDVIDKLDAGKREVSCGYTCDVEWTPGTTPDGQAYDAIQRPSALNHIALVSRGRAGSSCRVGDNWMPVTDNKEPVVATKMITFDGLPVEVTDAAEAVIRKLEGARDSLKTELADAVKDLADAKAEHDRAVAAKDAELAEAKAKVVDQAQIDRLADEKAAVVTLAKQIVGDSLETAGKTVADIRREVVKAKGVTVDGKSDDYVEAYFDTLKPAVTDSFREVVKDGVQNVGDADAKRLSARDAYLAELTGKKDK